MKEEFNLTSKRYLKVYGKDEKEAEVYYFEEDVKEFIKRLKEELMFQKRDVNGDGDVFVPIGVINEIIDKLAGDKLI